MIRPSSSLGRLSNLKVFEYRRCLMLSTTLHHIKSLLTIGTYAPMCELGVVQMKVQFGTAKNGWLPCRIRTESQEYEIDISYMPNDFMLELTNSLHGALSSKGTSTATSPSEPIEHEWIFYRIQDSVVFTLKEYPGSSREKGIGRDVFQHSGSTLDVILPFWRALKELSGRKRKEGFHTHWTQHWAHPFPTKSLEDLSEKLEKTKNEHNQTSLTTSEAPPPPS